MSEIEVFRFEDYDVRTVMIDGEPWWVLRDVCDVLGLSNPTMVASRVNPDGLKQAEVVDRLGRRQPSTTIVNEVTLYRVIWRSDKPAAALFAEWAAEKIGELRKTGAVMGRTMTAAELLVVQAQALVDAERRLAKQQKELTEHAAQIKDLKAGTYDWYAGSGYAALKGGLPDDVGYLQKLGRLAGQVGREWGVEPGKAPSRLFGKVNTWPVEVWDEALLRVELERD